MKGTDIVDEYQQRYLSHRERKAAAIAQEGTPLSERNPERRSVRVFEARGIPSEVMGAIIEAARMAPQSCNRQAIELFIVPGALLHDWLLGGTGWANKAPLVALLFADLAAYKSPGEEAFMPWLDAGVMLATLTYAAHDQGVGSCIINPRIKAGAEASFDKGFNPHGLLFCGAVALGYPAIVPDMPEKKPMEEMVEWSGVASHLMPQATPRHTEVDLGNEHFISIADLTTRILDALERKEPFSLTRWADSSCEIMKYYGKRVRDPQYLMHPNGPIVHDYRGGILTHAYYEEYAKAFLYGAQTCDVLGVFCDDGWVKQAIGSLPLDITGKPLVYAWANKFLFVRREVVEGVLERPWRTALVGNPMPKFREWLAERFPKLEIVQCGKATDWPDVADAIEEFKETKPELLLASAGWFTSCLVGAARDVGGVALSCGHLPDWWMADPPILLPNTEFPRGAQGMLDHCEAAFKGLTNVPERRIIADMAEVVRAAEELEGAGDETQWG